MKKIAMIYLDNGEILELRLGDIFDNEVALIEKHIIDSKFFKYYNQYINMLHIIKIEVKDEMIERDS